MTDKDPVRRLLRERVAEEVRALLARKMMTGADLATAMGKSPMYVSRRIRGEVAFDLDDMERLADVLGVSVADLMPQQVGTAKQINDRSTPISPTATGITTPRRSTHRPPARVSAGQRRPVSVRSPGYTMPSAHAA